MILYSQVFIVRHPPAVLSLIGESLARNRLKPFDGPVGEVGDDAVATELAQPLPVALAVRRPRHDLDPLRVRGLDELAVDVLKAGEEPRRAEPLGVADDVDDHAEKRE